MPDHALHITHYHTKALFPGIVVGIVPSAVEGQIEKTYYGRV